MALVTRDGNLSQAAVSDFIRRKSGAASIPSSVYRLQLNRDLTFRKAAEIIPFLSKLGIEAVFCSPYLQAAPGSMHGYDITDPQRLNPEIGSEEDFQHFCKTLKDHGMEQILDVVPNHMGISGNNRLWMDVLENGPGSLYARFFDIDWQPVKPELKDKVLLPVLGDYYGKVLENGELRPAFTNGGFEIRYYDHVFPISPETYPLILGHKSDQLREKLGANHSKMRELTSILEACRELPPSSERSEEKRAARHRDKEAVKARLTALAQASPPVSEHIRNAILDLKGKKGNRESFDRLDQLLNLQNYRLAYWRVAAEEINYRRFFDVNSLAAIHMEDPAVFEHSNRLIFDWVEEGNVQGLRIDHPDGLYDPAKYFLSLQLEYLGREFRKEFGNQWSPQEVTSALKKSWGAVEGNGAAPLYVVLEKILDRKENLPENWNVYGTVGYEFLNALNGLYVDPKNEKAFDEFYESFIEHPIDFEELSYQKKYFFAKRHMASEINTLAHRLNGISEGNRLYRDLTLNLLTEAVRKAVVCFPVYRTYISPADAEPSRRDEKYIRIAIEKAKSRSPGMDPTVFDFLESVLLLKLDAESSLDERKRIREFILKFQQITAAIMAKGIEDTTFYVNSRFLSLNEVGGDPEHFGTSPREFHQQNLHRARFWPQGFLATSTHDNKRSEDVRFRLNVLSEVPDEWKRHVGMWAAVNQQHKTTVRGKLEPTRNTEYLIYQTLAGVWPNEAMNDEAYAQLTERCWAYVLKAVREAKIYTDWVDPNSEYEKAVEKFLRAVLARADRNPFLETFIPFQARVSRCGALNSISALALKNAAPGVVDSYQGNETLDFSLVDPDNRRPVDYERRTRLLESLERDCENLGVSAAIRKWLEAPDDGRVKMYMLWKQLNARRRNRELFLHGDYIPLDLQGEKADQAVAYLRTYQGRRALVAAGRFFAPWTMENQLPLGDVWGDAAVRLPQDFEPDPLWETYSERAVFPRKDGEGLLLPLSDLFKELPAALLTY